MGYERICECCECLIRICECCECLIYTDINGAQTCRAPQTQILQRLLPLPPLGPARHGSVHAAQAHHVHVICDELLLFLELEPPARLPLGFHAQLPQIFRQGINSAGCLLHPLTGALVLLPDELHAGLGAQVYLATLREDDGRVLVTPPWLTVYFSHLVRPA